MKIICKTTDLLDAVNTVQKAVSSKSTLPILDGILIECANIIKFTGNNLEIGIEYILNGVILETGSIVVNSKILGDIIRKLPDSDVCMEVKDDKVSIDCLKCHFELAGILPEGFPRIPRVESENCYKIEEKTFREMVKGTIFAVSSDESKKNLTGSLVEWNNKNLVLVSIDGFRMAIKRNSNIDAQGEFSVIVPGSALHEIAKIIQNDDNKMQIAVSKSLISFKFGNCTFVSRLVEAEFMNYKNIIPDFHQTHIRTNTKEFLFSLERAYLISMEDKKYPVKFEITEDKLIISSTATIGHIREEVNGEIIGIGMEIGFNPRYFIDALRVIEDEQIDIFFTSNVGPATIKPIIGDNFAYMILPVKMSPDIMQKSEEND